MQFNISYYGIQIPVKIPLNIIEHLNPHSGENIPVFCALEYLLSISQKSEVEHELITILNRYEEGELVSPC